MCVTQLWSILIHSVQDIRYFKIHYPIMSTLVWGMGDTIAISQLAVKVYAAYKDAPDDCRHISEEVMPLQLIIYNAVRYLESTTLSGNDRQLGQKALKSCHSMLEGLDSLIIEKGNSICAEDIATLGAKLILNSVLLSGFIQRFEIPIR